MSDAKPSAAMIAAGKCPGWTYANEYEADTPYGRGCGKPTTRGDLCGNHDNRRSRENERRADWAERRAELSASERLADLLTERFGVTVHAERGRVYLDNREAERLLGDES